MSREDRPLLVSMLDSACGYKGSDEEAYIDAKWGKPLSIRQKWKAGRIRGRARSMAKGAASVINRWPDHLTICWLFAMASCMMIVACILMLVGASKRLNSHPNTFQSLQKQCILRHNAPPKILDKTNIHLHLIINEGESFNPYKYKNALKDTLKKHPNHAINIYVLLNDTSDQTFKRNSRFKNWEQSQKGLDRYKFFDTSSAESEDTVTPLPLITGIGVNVETVKVVRSTFSNYFQHSPLSATWKTITPHAMPIVFRVLTLWEHGGIAMPWQMFLDKSDNHNPDKSINSQIRDLVKELQKNYTADNFKVKKSSPHQLLDDLHDVVNLGGLTIETGIYASQESPLVVGRGDNITEQIPPQLKNKNNRGKPNDKKTTEESEDSSESDSGSSSGDDSSSYSESSESSESSSYSDESYSDRLPKSIESHEPARLSLRPVESVEFVAHEINRFMNKGGKKIVEQQPKKEPKEQPHLRRPQNKKRLKRSLFPMSEEEKPYIVDLFSIGHSSEDAKSVIDKIPLDVPEEFLEQQFKKDIHDPFKELYGHMASSEVFLNMNDPIGHKLQPVDKKPGLPFDQMYKALNAKIPSMSDENSSRFSASSSESSGSDSMETFKGIFGPISDVIRKPKIKRFHEDKSHRLYEPFDHMNVFAMPNKLSVTLDQFGYYFATKKPCHAYLGQLISLLQSRGNLDRFQEIIPESLRMFCREEKLSNCNGIMLL